jgi:molybdate transport system ATP-binding protein
VLHIDIIVRRSEFTLHARIDAITPGLTAIFGSSGAGKSTLAHAIAGLVPATGKIQLEDTVWLDSSHHKSLPAEARRIGYVFQDARLFPHLDVRDNLRFAEHRAQHHPCYVGYSELIELLGLQPLLQRRAHQLSGGERQRVALGRALLSQPKLLILDEPLAALDVARREEVLPYLELLRDRYQVPMLYVSHQYDEVLRLATQVVLLGNGTVQASGTPAALSLDPHLRTIIGHELIGSVLEATVVSIDAATNLATVAIGHTLIRLTLAKAAAGSRIRLHVLARDVLLANRAPEGLSVRNVLPGIISALTEEGRDAVLVTIDMGAERILSRVTHEAVSDLALRPGMPIWALVKAASLRSQSFSQGRSPAVARSTQQ